MIQRYQTHVTCITGCTAAKHASPYLHLSGTGPIKAISGSVNINMGKTVHCYSVIVQTSAVTSVISSRIDRTSHNQVRCTQNRLFVCMGFIIITFINGP